MGHKELRAEEWAQAEFGGIDLGDVRRTSRLVKLGAAMADRPAGTLPGLFAGWAALKATYRLLSREEVTYAGIMEAHVQRTREACREPGHYLLIEDSSSLDYSTHRGAADLGWIGDGGGWGLNIHTSLALRVERWQEDGTPEILPVGLFEQNTWSRTYKPGQRKRAKKAVRLSRKRESQRWAASLDATDGPPDGTSWTYIADRESDIYEVFERCEDMGVGFVIRASQHRALHEEDGSVFTAVAEAAVVGTFQHKLRARPGVAARTATLEVRTALVTLRAPWRPGVKLEPRAINVVEVKEIDAPSGVKPLLWVLFTSWDCDDFTDCLKVVRSYTKRWIIEEYYKAIKTGVGVEDTQLTTRSRIEALLAVMAIAAVRLLRMKLLVATCPDSPIETGVVGEEALEILELKHGKPAAGWTNRTLWVGIARLGGFLARRGDGNPGWQTIWRGWQALVLMIEGAELWKGRSKK